MPPKSWSNARAIIQLPPSGPPDQAAMLNTQVNDKMKGNGERSGQAFPTSTQAKEQQGLITVHNIPLCLMFILCMCLALNGCIKSCCTNYTDGTNYCELPMDEGRGVGEITRYFYNSSSGICEEFSYGGCGGNENNFLSTEVCRQHCNPSSESACL